jgi:hypothetical protein
MNLQNKVINQYRELHKFPTLQFIAQDTGIQITRVFRILNGLVEMKISEYESMLTSIQRIQHSHLGLGYELQELARLTHSCQVELSKDQIEEICEDLKMKLRLNEYLSAASVAVGGSK